MVKAFFYLAATAAAFLLAGYSLYAWLIGTSQQICTDRVTA